MMRAAPPEGAAAALRGRAERPPYEGVLTALAVPALVVVGDQDAFTTRADAEAMHRLLAGSELLWLPGIGHMPNLEAAAEASPSRVSTRPPSSADSMSRAANSPSSNAAASSSHATPVRPSSSTPRAPWR